MLIEILLLVTTLLLAMPLFLFVRRLSVRQRSRERLYDIEQEDAAPTEAEEDEGRLARWLGIAGYRGSGVVANFLSLCILGAFAGLGLTATLYASGIVRSAGEALDGLPGSFASIFLPLVYLLPWTPPLLGGMLPYVAVRRKRRQREEQVEQDLPLLLDLLATLSEAGMGFDAALGRVLDSMPLRRPIALEFRAFQREILAGRQRVRSLRRLTRRLEVTSFSIFISALVQAEQTGMGLAEVLRRQAEDLRDRRRERALATAMALPVKLLFPLVICFLPGIFVATLGPTFYQIFQVADNLLRSRGL